MAGNKKSKVDSALWKRQLADKLDIVLIQDEISNFTTEIGEINTMIQDCLRKDEEENLGSRRMQKELAKINEPLTELFDVTRVPLDDPEWLTRFSVRNAARRETK